MQIQFTSIISNFGTPNELEVQISSDFGQHHQLKSRLLNGALVNLKIYLVKICTEIV